MAVTRTPATIANVTGTVCGIPFSSSVDRTALRASSTMARAADGSSSSRRQDPVSTSATQSPGQLVSLRTLRIVGFVGPSIRWTGWDKRHPRQMTALARPRSRWCDDYIADCVREGLVVDAPSVEIRPCLLGRALHGKAGGLEPGYPSVELFEGKFDRIIRKRVRVVVDLDRVGHIAQAREPHSKAETGLRGSLRWSQRQIQRG